MALFRGLAQLRGAPRFPRGLQGNPDELLKEAERNAGVPMPGPISGYGGGTWNIDGSAATLPDRTVSDPVAQARSARRRAAADVEEYDPTVPYRDDDGEAKAPLRDAPRLAEGGDTPIDPRVRAILGDAPRLQEKGPKSFWAGTGKFGWRDALMTLGALGDSDGSTAADLGDMRSKGIAARQKAEAAYQRAQQVASLPGMNAREFAAYMGNPEQWASHMANALSSHQSAVNVGQTETRVFGNPAQGGSVYQPTRLVENGVDQLRYDPQTGSVTPAVQGMTDGEQYARSLGHEPGSKEWISAVRDAELRGDGPTAFGQDRAMEAQRQSNRLGVRKTPTYRDLNPPPPRATKPGTAKRSQIVSVSTPAEARALPKGTRYRGSDGVVRER